jgi:hypothetical protein
MNRLVQIIQEEISAISRDKDKEIFDYESVQEDTWNEPKTRAQEFQRINFDFENDYHVAKKTFFAKVMLRKDQPVKNEFNVELMEAGGDWEMPVMYFRVEFTHQYGLVSNKYCDNPEYVWDVGNEDGNLPSGKKYVLIPPVEAGNKLVKGESDSGKYDWFAYQNSDITAEEEKEARITDTDRREAWKWIQELLEKLVKDRHERLDDNKESELEQGEPDDDKKDK